MLLTEVWDFFDYWRKNPPAHIILAGVHMDRKQDVETTKAEESLAAVAGPARSFDQLPLAIQRHIEESRKRRG